MSEVKAFYDFMKEREQIRLNKESGLSWPWTKDPIFQEYKFTNVKRSDDKTTRLLKKEFYDKNQDAKPEVQLLNCAIFRYFGTIEFARAIGWQKTFEPEKVKSVAKNRLENGERVFTGAYMITNLGRKGPKQDIVVDTFIAGLWYEANELVKDVQENNSWMRLIHKMMIIEGFGGTGFMSKEVVLDTMLTSFWKNPPVDLNTWCPAGPGARRGLNRLHGRDLNFRITEKQAVEEMIDIFDQRTKFWPLKNVSLELHDIQFQLCEFDKYLRVRNNEGRPRSKYRKGAIDE